MGHACTKTGDGAYAYRGVSITRNDRERGHWGHWEARVGSIMQGTNKTLRAATRRVLLTAIDGWFEENATKP